MFKRGDIVKLNKELESMPWYTDKIMKITQVNPKFDGYYFVDHFTIYGDGCGLKESDLYLVSQVREAKLKRILCKL